MKKVVSIITIASISLLACNKVAVMPEISEENPTETQDVSTPRYHTVTLNAAINPEVKSAYDPTDNVTFSWSAYDQISVLFHKGDDNKFFPLTTTTGGSNSATFSGSIEDGWELGSNEATPRYWALFPASDNHTYTKDAANPITFHIPATTDYTTGEHPHFSADVPMATSGWDGSDTFNMGLLCGAYKVTFTNINASKVKLEVTNVHSSSRVLSGNYPVVSGTTLKNSTDDGASGSLSVSYIRNTEDGNAVFYIPYENWNALGPKFTLYNMDAGSSNGYIIFSATAKAKLESVESTKVVLVPSKDLSSYGAGTPFWSALGVNWASVTNVAAGDTGDGIDAVSSIKATADGHYVYVLLEIPNGNPLIYNIEGSPYSNRSYLFVGDGSGSKGYWSQGANDSIEAWLKIGNVATFRINTKGYIKGDAANVSVFNNIIYVEIALDRSSANMSSYMQKNVSSTVYAGLMVTDKYYAPGAGSSSGTGAGVGYAPAKSESMLAVTVPAYVAP